ncbi:MAG: hypothetical protein K6B70_02000 [Clostridia bacterium]|nr:hypothetical protein [Clostridia bacterium]
MNRKNKLLVAVFSVLFAVSVFSLIAKNLCQPLTEADIEQCTSIASDIYYNQKDALIYDVPENYTVEINDTTITVKPTDDRYGCVKCRLQNGKLVSNYDSFAIQYYSACGMLTFISYVVLLLFVLIICKIVFAVRSFIKKYKKHKEKSNTATA